MIQPFLPSPFSISYGKADGSKEPSALRLGGVMQGSPCGNAEYSPPEMRPPFSLKDERECAAPGGRENLFSHLDCGRPTPTEKPRQDRSYVARYGRSRTMFRLHVGLCHPQQRFRFYGALAPRAPAAIVAERFQRRTRLAALPRERPRSSRFAKPNGILRGGERRFDLSPIGRRNHVSGYRVILRSRAYAKLN